MANNKTPLTEHQKGFVQGYVCAITATIKSHGISTEVRETFQAGVPNSISELKRHGVDEYDIEVLLQHKNELKLTD